MKRIGFIYEQIISVDNCRLAILNASQHKRKRKQVNLVNEHLDEYANDLSKRLENLDFITPYRKRIVRDGLSGKEREIQVPAFYPDQCAHHAIVQILQPIILKSSYYWSSANIPKRGIDHARRGVERATRFDPKHAKYCVKMDIKKFYPSILHDRLKERLASKIKDQKALEILNTVIDSHEQGLPIGNYTSPWLAELYLQPLDHFIKQKLGVKHYIRCADDLVLIGSNKRKLHKAMNEILNFLDEMGLNARKDRQLFLIQRNCKDKHKRGRKIDFVGCCFGIRTTTVRKRRALAFMRQSRQIQKLQRNDRPVPFKTASGFLSRSACLKGTDSRALKEKYYDTININRLKEVIRDESKRRCFT